MLKNSTVLILGANGLLGNALKKLLSKRKFKNLLTPRSRDLNLLNQENITNYLQKKQPKFIFMCAGLVGGILGNKTNQADFIYQNTIMILNLLESIKILKIKPKLLYTGSTCIYPNTISRPIREDDFLSGKLEKTNIGYALAKITGIVACQKYTEQYGIQTISCMPTNLYGIGDNYNLQTGHFLAALIKKFVIAKKQGLKTIEFWGTGIAKREALFNEDCADVLIYLMKNYTSSDHVNIGTGFDYSVKEYVELMKDIVQFKGTISWDKTKPNGTLKKQTNIDQLKRIYPDFRPILFEEGVRKILNDKQEVKRILA